MKHVNGFGTKVRILGIATAATLAPPLAPTAASQQPEAGARPEEVVVTARKVEENLMTVPLAITAIDAFTFLVPPAKNEIRFGAPIPRSFGLRVSYDF